MQISNIIKYKNTLHVVQSHIHETKQGSKKSSNVFQIVLRGGGWEEVRYFAGGYFFIEWQVSEEQ